MVETMDTPRFVCSLHRRAQRVSLRVDISFVVGKSLCPAKYAKVYGSMLAAQHVRNGFSLANATAFRYCFPRLDFSMWPVRVGVGKTHSSHSMPRLMESKRSRVG